MAGFEVEVGRGLRDAAGEVAAAWRAAGEEPGVEPTSRVCVADWAPLAGLLTPPRLVLLRRLRVSAEPSVRALARTLGRDVKLVAEDVSALVAFGLAVRDEAGRLSCDLDEVAAVVRLAPPDAGADGPAAAAPPAPRRSSPGQGRDARRPA